MFQGENVTNNNTKNEFFLILVLYVRYDFSVLFCFFLQQKVDERKRNETRFDTITVSLKAIWFILILFPLCFYRRSSCNSRDSFPREKYRRRVFVCVLRELARPGQQQIAPMFFHLQSKVTSLSRVLCCCSNALTAVTKHSFWQSLISSFFCFRFFYATKKERNHIPVVAAAVNLACYFY